jgi:membrane fusion protein (multidrug efflux system)
MMKRIIVGRRGLEIGQSVCVGQDLIDILSLADVWITANVKDIQLACLRPGQSAEIKIDAWGALGRDRDKSGGHPNSWPSSVALKASTGRHVKTSERVPVRIDFDRPEDSISMPKAC